HQAITLFRRLMDHHLVPDAFTLPIVVKACAKLNAIQEGMQIHGLLLKIGFGFEKFVQGSLVNMYAKCGEIESACEMFDKIGERDLVSNSLIDGYAKSGQVDLALELFERDLFSWTALVDGFSKCKVETGREIFDRMPERTLVQCNAMINAYIQLLNTLRPKVPHFPAIQTRLLTTLSSSLLNLCNNPQSLKQIHARFILHGLHQNPTLSSKLIDSYANFGLPSLSQQVFTSIIKPNSFLFNSFIRCLSKFCQYEQTLLVFKDMLMISIYPYEETCSFVLNACSSLKRIEYGKLVHGFVLKLGFESCSFMGDSLVEMYNENKVVERMSDKDSSYWSCLINEAYQSGNIDECFRLFKEMRMEDVVPDSAAVINLLRSCVDLNSITSGRVVHCVVVASHLSNNFSVNTALLSMYSKLGCLVDAGLLYEEMPEKDCVVWNIMISAYSQNGCPLESLELLRCMAKSGVRPDLFTAIPAISSTRQLKSTNWGKEMHAHVIRNGSDYQVSVHNSLVDMYSECDHLRYARKVFDLVTNKTVVSWSTMIKGYISHDMSLDALSLFSKMKLDGVRVDFVTVINILPACVNIGALEQVKYLHGYSMKFGLNSFSSVNTAFLVSYAKCGCIEMARILFDEERIDSKDIITWNSMISAYAKHGDWSQCFKLYNQMKKSFLKPDRITLVGLLTACVNSGLVKEGRGFFKEMIETYGCRPGQEHYACMVDLLGRAGNIDEARELVKTMPFKPDARVWGSLLSACKMHSKTQLAEVAAENLITMEPKNAGNYVLLSNIYAASGKWDRVAKMRTLIRDRGLQKTAGCSWVEISGLAHEFRVADRSHPEANFIYAILGNLEVEIKE
ncbi:LOW QUALITY PROTEIN: PPR domain-containing protein/PPR_1 domain-containing protein/PPR_2 domain-containing protein/PPR_3 domain-containing protein, partial [Cephalotus follicularis]